MITKTNHIRHVLLMLLLLGSTAAVQAQLNSGYYRLLNTETERYLTVTNDNVGWSMESAFAALVTVKGFENVESNPASILYFRNAGSGNFDVVAQGADSYELTNLHFNIASKGNGVYNGYGRYLTTTYYLADNVNADKKFSQADINGTARDWYILPITLAAGQYFGFTAECQDKQSNRYTTCYASFPYELYDNGLKAYYVSHVIGKYAVIEEVTSDIPEATPVIIKCVAREAKSNRANILNSSPAAISTNKLKGVYFDKTNGLNPEWTPYDENTMRVIGITSEGKLGFVKTTRYRLEANKAYLPVEAGSPDQFTCITRADYEAQFGPIDDNKKGDLNGDGTVDVGDIMTIINVMAGQGGNITASQADLNGDGTVDVGDIMAIINLMAGK